ncbi:MAG TPA: cupin domain-containing protein [Thermodesulfobacteriota bacterium]|nr:cupin domain-containing protein [Thermodesulfobacteriota bacterium]
MGSTVVREDEREFSGVEWGRTKNLFGPENVGARYLKINITEYAAGGEHKLHRHPDQEEVIYILDGEGISRTDAGDQPIRTGSFVFVPAGTDHATINLNKNKPMKAIIIKGPPEEKKGK